MLPCLQCNIHAMNITGSVLSQIGQLYELVFHEMQHLGDTVTAIQTRK